MAQFTRRTILAATDTMANWGHTNIDRFLLEHALEEAVRGNSRADRANALGRYLIGNPETLNEDGANLADAVVGELVEEAIRHCVDGYPREFSFEVFRERYPALHRGLERDGFTVEDGTLRRALPEALDLPRADDEVHALLDRYGFAVSRGHLDQGIAAHARGDWAAANAQFRPFIESLFDAIAERLAAGAALPPPGNQRRIWLANRNPPFFLADLNEWDGQGHGFIEAFFRRLHPAGAHPGLSDEDDSTFRLHLVLLVARKLLRRV
ncbi:MAG TPA: hypothetical protein VMH80_03760 [Bryobacteraceae bacterium]|nr:hypothetical protein [Bryobacteraceae bacterium]